MTITFTEDELEYINKKFGHWTIKKDCPKEIKKSINKKFKVFSEIYKEYNKKKEGD